MASYPTGVTVLTALAGQAPSGMTANAVCSLSLQPLLMLACIARSARTLEPIRASRAFAINVLASDQHELARRFASSRPGPDKWEGVRWHVRAGTPVIERSAAWIGCRLSELRDGGDHVIAIGEVVDLEGSDAEPLVWHLGDFRQLA